MANVTGPFDGDAVLEDLSASQAAKLLHLDPDEIAALAPMREMLVGSTDRIISRLHGQLSILPGGAELLGGLRRAGRLQALMRKWLDRGLRPWDPEVREPRLRHLAMFCARRAVPLTYVSAIFSCLGEVCLEVISQAGETGGTAPGWSAMAARVFRRRLATERLAFQSICCRWVNRQSGLRTAQLEQTIHVRSERLRSTVTLSQAVTGEIDEPQVVRVLAEHVVRMFQPSFLAIHTIQAGDFIETPVSILDGEPDTRADDDAMRLLRKDWRLCRAARTGQICHVEDVAASLVGCPHQAWSQSTGSYCCVPLASGTQVLGWMHLRRAETGGFCPEELEVLGIYGQMAGTAITSLRLVQENRQQATTDPLTGLYNRRYFENVMRKEDLILQRRDGSASLVMLDVDEFKQFNDRFGHDTGDRVLTSFAAALRECVRQTDEVARLGGDEFVVLLRDCDCEHAGHVAEKIIHTARQTSVRLDAEHSQHLHVSAGVAGCPEHARTLDETLLLADVALLRAKEAGRNRFEAYDAGRDGAALGARGGQLRLSG